MMRPIDGKQLKKELDKWAVSFSDPRCYVIGDAKVVIDNIPTIDAVPIKPLSAWLAGYAAPPKYALEQFPESEWCLANTRAAAWEHHIRTLMECGLMEESHAPD